MSSISRILISLTLTSAVLLTLSGSPRTASARVSTPLSSRPAPTARVQDEGRSEGHRVEPCTQKGKDDDKRRDKGRGQDDEGCLDAGSSSGIAKADFNGDNFGDLAIGVPGEDIDGISNTGAVHVIYGSVDGLTATGSQFFTRRSLFGAQNATFTTNGVFGYSLAAGDFNGDGKSDLTIGNPGVTSSGQPSAGEVYVLYGSPGGLTTVGLQGFGQGLNGLQETGERDDRFGHSLAWGNFNGDAFGDLVVGVPLEDVGTIRNAGAVQIIYGTAQGLRSSGNQLWHQNSFGIEDSCEAEDRFGLALAGGDFNGNGFGDLAIGVPSESVGSIADAGAVSVMYGVSQIGLSSTGDQFWTQDSVQGFANAPILDQAEAGDRFGSSLAAGDFDTDFQHGGDPFTDDLAIGVPFEDVQIGFDTNFQITDAGAVNVIYGFPSQGGLTVLNNQLWTQDSPGVPNEAEEGDQFGSSLAAGNFDKTTDDRSTDDLAIGVPNEDFGTILNAGAVNVIYGNSSNFGLDATGLRAPQFLNQGTEGIIDVAAANERFGAALTAWNFGKDLAADLAIGVPGETVNFLAGAGAVHVLYGLSPTFTVSDGLEVEGNQQWTQNSTGIADIAETDDGFGAALY